MKLATFQAHIDEMCRQRNMSLTEAAKKVRDMGIVSVCVGSDWIGDPLQERERIENAGLVVSDVFGNINFFHRKDSSADIERLLERCSILGANRLLITTNGYRDPKNQQMCREDITNTARGLALAARLAKNYGILIVVEDYDMNEGPFTYGEALEEVFIQAGEVAFAFDSGNFAHGGEDPVEQLTRLKRWLAPVVHFKDRSRKPYGQNSAPTHHALDGNIYYPCPVGSGIIDFESIALILRQEGFDGTILLEHFDAPDQYEFLEKSSAFVKKLL